MPVLLPSREGAVFDHLKELRDRPARLLVANATASDSDLDDDWLKKKDGEILDDWLVRVQGEAVTQLTGNEKLGKTVATYIEGAANLSAFFASSTTALAGSWSLIKYFKTSKVLNAPDGAKKLGSALNPFD